MVHEVVGVAVDYHVGAHLLAQGDGGALASARICVGRVGAVIGVPSEGVDPVRDVEAQAL